MKIRLLTIMLIMPWLSSCRTETFETLPLDDYNDRDGLIVTDATETIRTPMEEWTYA